MIEKKRKYYAPQETVWLKEEKTTGVVKSIDTKNLEVTVTVTKVWSNVGDGITTVGSGGVSQYDKTLKLWQITKYLPNVRRTLSRKAKPLTVKVKYLTELDDVFKPIEKISIGDWIDLRCAETISLEAGQHALIKLGFAMQLPIGYEAHVTPRSSTFKNFGVLQTNTPGIIDNLYCGDNDQWFMSVYATRKTTIIRGERVCQMKLVRKMPEVNFITVDTLGNPDRGGHGSTGTK